MRDLTRHSVLLAPTALAAAASPEPVQLPNKIRVGILGLDRHTVEITAPFNCLPHVFIDSYWSADAAKLGRAPNAKRYDDWKAMLDSEKLDVVAITNNNGERAQAIIEAAKRKINVVAEKPLATDRAALKAVRAAVEQNGISLG